MKKVIALILCTAMFIANITPVWAEDMDGAYESEDFESEENYDDSQDYVEQQTESIPEYEDDCDDKEGENHDEHDLKSVVNDDKSPAYSLAISNSRISFGKQTVGYPIDSQAVTVSNTGSTEVSLIWKDVDPDCAFMVDTTNAQKIAPGSSATIYVSVATNKGVGAYSGVILFANNTDTAYTSGVKLETSVTIVQEEARIKKFSLSPAQISASPNSSVNFSTKVEGEGDFDSNVLYSVTGNTSTDTYIDERGRLNIASNETGSVLTVKAVSAQDKSIYKEATVNIKNNTYTVNVYASPARGGDVTGSGAYAQGSKVVLKAYSSNGWYFSGWQINGAYVSSGTNYTIDNINQGYEVVAIFEQECVRIKAKPNHSSMGTVEGDGLADVGDTVILKAKAKDGYRFSCWMEGKKKLSTDNKLKLKDVDEDREITAIFVKDECVVSVASCDKTMGSVSGGKKVSYGKDVTIKAKANSGYRFVRWVCNDQEISTQAEYKLKDIKDDITVVAVFEAEQKDSKNIFKLTSGTTDGNGVISPSGEVMIEKGKSINYTITPKSGYQIAAIAIDGKQVAVSSSITISNIKSNHTIVAAFLPIASAQTTDKKKVEESQKAAEESDINGALDASPDKKYDEYIVDTSVDTSTYIGTEADSMDNSLDDEQGVLQECNITSEEAASQLGDDAFKYEIVRRAVTSENLEVNIDNSMRKNKFVMSYEETALENEETANFAKILCGVFTEDEIMDIAQGKEKVLVNVSITGAKEDNVPIGQVTKIKENAPSGLKPGQYFYADFMKSVDGEATEISEFNVPLMVTVDIPDRIYKNGGVYKIARLHTLQDGSEELTILDDVDSDPMTITFETDKFSTYAILCDADIDVDVNQPLDRPTIKKKSTSDTVIIVVAAAVCGLLTMIAGITITRINIKRRKHRKSKSHSRAE